MTAPSGDANVFYIHVYADSPKSRSARPTFAFTVTSSTIIRRQKTVKSVWRQCDGIRLRFVHQICASRVNILRKPRVLPLRLWTFIRFPNIFFFTIHSFYYILWIHVCVCAFFKKRLVFARSCTTYSIWDTDLTLIKVTCSSRIFFRLNLTVGLILIHGTICRQN